MSQHRCDENYTYATFEASLQEFFGLAVNAPKSTTRAVSCPLEDLTTGQNMEMRNLGNSGVTSSNSDR